MAVLEKGTKFPSVLAKEVFSKVKGHSSLAKLSNTAPVAFTGTDIFTFGYDAEVSIVGESEAKGHGGVTAEPVNIRPIKIEYGARVSDEFLFASEETQIDILSAFTDGFAKKAARGLDIMAFTKTNPKTGQTSALITNDFTAVTNTVSLGSNPADVAIEDAVALLGDYDANGIAISKAMAGKLAKETTADGAKMFPELAWGANPDVINGLNADVNSTLGSNLAIVGDFENAFKWGYAKDIDIEVIEYGDPDNTGSDLKGHNQVYLRGEAYIGFAVLSNDAFAIVTA